MTVEDLRASAGQLRDVLRVLDEGRVQASGRERAFIVGALRAVELIGDWDDRPTRPDVET